MVADPMGDSPTQTISSTLCLLCPSNTPQIILRAQIRVQTEQTIVVWLISRDHTLFSAIEHIAELST